MGDIEYETLHEYMLDAMRAETGRDGAFYLLAPGAKEWSQAHVVEGHPAFAGAFEAEFRWRADGNQSPGTTMVYL